MFFVCVEQIEIRPFLSRPSMLGKCHTTNATRLRVMLIMDWNSVFLLFTGAEVCVSLI
jgi:hypothetical protein